MADNEQHQKKQFSVPSRDELIQLIKDLDQEIDHVTLNLIKCDFNATENDIRKTFPEFNFIKVKNYNPGSFEVVFEMRIDAINFIRNHYDKKILNRRFFIKMGRQFRQVIEDWTGVGNMPRQFRGPNKPYNNQNKPGQQQRNKKPEDQKNQESNQEKTTEEKTATKEQVKTETKTQVKQEVKAETKPQEQPKKQGKVIPKFENHYKKTDYKKPHQEGEKKSHVYVGKETQQPKKEETQQPKKEEIQQPAKKEAQQPKKQETQQPAKKETQQPKKQEIQQPAKKETQQPAKKETEKKEVAQKKEEKVEPKKQPAKEQPAAEDDGWITVPTTKNQKRR